ncbi:AAA ATPase, AAA+ lid domain [Dillenia turbinata]|uniref:AAA ATPase, AAA+ lid domain n=1 Tax=Dillenia turbinata TaxID=194707 RepID=A0AAN8VPQ9_9MAGN
MSKWFGDASKLGKPKKPRLRRTTEHEALTNMKTEFVFLGWLYNRCFFKPNRSDREKILKVILKGEKIERNIKFDYIASLCEGYTGSDLLELCKQAACMPIRDFLSDEKKGRSSLVKVRPSSQLNLEKAVALSRKTRITLINPTDTLDLNQMSRTKRTEQLEIHYCKFCFHRKENGRAKSHNSCTVLSVPVSRASIFADRTRSASSTIALASAISF